MASAITETHALRAEAARIERGSASHRADRDDHADRWNGHPVPLGDPPTALDRLLGGGLRRGSLHEIVPAGARDEAAATAFAIALTMRCAGTTALIWIIEDGAARESGLPYRPGLAAMGIAVDRLVVVRTRDSRMTLWATEEALRAGTPAVVTELWGGQSYDLVAGRRLLLAARRHGAVSVLVHAGLPHAAALSSPADLRFAVGAHPTPRQPSAAAGRMPVPGPGSFGVRLLKRRTAATATLPGFDRDRVHPLVWNRDAHFFSAPDAVGMAAGGRAARPAGAALA